MDIETRQQVMVDGGTIPGAPCVYDGGRYAPFIRTRTMGRVRGLCFKDFFTARK